MKKEALARTSAVIIVKPLKRIVRVL